MFPQFGWYYGILGLLVQAALIVVAVRAYLARRTDRAVFVLLAIICYAIVASSWFTFPFVAGFFWGSHLTPHSRLVLADSRYYAEQSLQLLFAAFMIAALVSFTRERSVSGAPHI
jgi:hypothetical protein